MLCQYKDVITSSWDWSSNVLHLTLPPLCPLQLADAKKKVDEDQAELEEMQGVKRKLDKEIESLHERIEELTAENQKTMRSKKKIQGEVGGALEGVQSVVHCPVLTPRSFVIIKGVSSFQI